MPDQDPKTVVERWFDEVWNQGSEGAIDELFAYDGVAHGLGQGEADVSGPAGFKPFWRNMRTALPDAQIQIQHTLAEGDSVAVRVVLEGTHMGDGLGSPATGRQVRIAGIVIVRIAGGQIVEAWNSWDQLGLLQQLGALAPATAPDRFLAANS